MLVVLAPSSHFYGCTEGQSHTKWVKHCCSGKVEVKKNSEGETLQRVGGWLGAPKICSHAPISKYREAWPQPWTLALTLENYHLHLLTHTQSLFLFSNKQRNTSAIERTRIPLRLMWEPDTFHISYVVTTTIVLPQSYCSHSTNRQGSTTCEFVLCDASTLPPLWKPTHTSHKDMLKDKGCPPPNLFD